LGLFLLAVGATGPLRGQCPDGTPPPCAARPARLAAPPANSVAVLYFDNLSRDTADAYLADGLTEEIISRLGDVPRLVVKSRSAVRRFRGTADDPASLGRALAAAWLVSGGVRRSGERLRVDVELTRAATGVRAWGHQYERPAGDLFAIEGEIAQEVTRNVAGQLLPAERGRLLAVPTGDPAAYDLYLRGNRAAWDATLEGTQAGIAFYEQALRLDPHFAAALGRIAYAHGWLANWNFTLPGVARDSLVARGLAFADRALREDSASSDAWLGRGMLLFYWDPPDYAGSLEALGRAAALDSTSAAAHQAYGMALRRLGDFPRSAAEYRAAIAVDPANSHSMADLGLIAFTFRRYAEARAWYDSALAHDPAAWFAVMFRARVQLDLGDTADARADAAHLRRLAPEGARPIVEPIVAQIQALLGDTAAARATLAPELRDLEGAGDVEIRAGFETALAFAVLGERDRAMALLTRIRPGGAWLWSYLVMPWFDPLRADPRFQQLLRASRPPGAVDPT
jgi:TolB-like protein/tetratricopeptide (TPR) repeat protein